MTDEGYDDAYARGREYALGQEFKLYIFNATDDQLRAAYAQQVAAGGVCQSCAAKGISWDAPRDDGGCYECGAPTYAQLAKEALTRRNLTA